MKPGVMAPSHMPRKTRHANRSPKFFAAAWQSSETDQMKMLMLYDATVSKPLDRAVGRGIPHPFPYWEILQCKVLWPFKGEEEEVEDRPEPVELVLRDVGSLADVHVKTSTSLMRDGQGVRRTKALEWPTGPGWSCRQIASWMNDGSVRDFKRPGRQVQLTCTGLVRDEHDGRDALRAVFTQRIQQGTHCTSVA